MILEVIKLVAETPTKAVKVVINSSRLLFALVLSIFFYKLFVGPWNTGQTSELDLWRDWIATGRVLFSAFFFVVAYVALFYLFPVITTLPLILYQRSHPLRVARENDLGQAIKAVLLRFSFLQSDSNGRVHATRHTAELIALVKHFEIGQEESGEFAEADATESSSFLDIWHLYVLLMLFFVFVGAWVHWGLDIILLVGAIIFVIVYRVVTQFYDFLRENSVDILFVLGGMEETRHLEQALAKRHCPVVDRAAHDGIPATRVFHYRGQHYHFLHLAVRGSLTASLFHDVLVRLQKQQEPTVLFLSGQITADVREEILNRGSWLTVVCYRTISEAMAGFETVFPADRPFHVFLQR